MDRDVDSTCTILRFSLALFVVKWVLQRLDEYLVVLIVFDHVLQRVVAEDGSHEPDEMCMHACIMIAEQ